MFTGKLVFTQAMDHLPLHTFRRCVQRYNGNRYIKRFSCQEQFRCMAFAQLTFRESLRDIEACLNAQSSKLYHMGICSSVARSTLADANEKRDWRIYADFAQSLVQIARRLYAGEDLGLDNTVYALDATTIDLCLTVFPWAHFRQTKAAVKLHTLLDLRGNIPSFVHISDGKLHDVNVLDLLLPEPGAFSTLWTVAIWTTNASTNWIKRKPFSSSVQNPIFNSAESLPAQWTKRSVFAAIKPSN